MYTRSRRNHEETVMAWPRRTEAQVATLKAPKSARKK
jgi:hypothetical protein